MGHVVRTIDDFEYLKSLVSELDTREIDKDFIEEIFLRLIPRDKDGNLLIKYNIKEKGGVVGIFYPSLVTLSVSLPKIKKWCIDNAKDLAEYCKIDNIRLIEKYMLLMVITHELEHAYQYLIGEGVIETNSAMLKNGYKALYDLLIPKDYILPRPIKQIRRGVSIIAYKRHENEYLLERNAQMDSLALLADVALDNGHNEIFGMFNGMKNTFGTAGYIENADGTLINTFKNIYMGDSLKRIISDYNHLDIIERYRLGLPVDDDTRKRILALK